MTTVESREELLRLLGIEAAYTGQTGQSFVPDATIGSLLATLGYAADTEMEVRASLAMLQRRRVEAPVEPVTMARADDGPPSIAITRAATAKDAVIAWKVQEEGGSIHRGEARFGDLPLIETIEFDGSRYERRRLILPGALPLGYHRARIDLSDERAAPCETLLIVVPMRAYCPPALEAGRGVWGLAIQLYALRSQRNWGIGDFTDLAAFIRRAAVAGAGAIGVNPLHALYADEPERASPYGPSSRYFLNTLYLDVPAIADFAECAEAQALVAAPEFQARLRQLRLVPLVNYAAVAACKDEVLAPLHAHFAGRHLAAATRRAAQFRAFQQEGGAELRRFAVFQTLRAHLGAADPAQRFWRNWPSDLHDPDSAAVDAFARAHAARIEYFEYLQWQADLQLRACVEAAKAEGMAVGLYQDLAIGVDAGGADAWTGQDVAVQGWSIGAPPDEWNLKGQVWGLAPIDPIALRRRAYDTFIAVIRASMRHAAALRIDHVLGLWRLFWVPDGQPPAAGVYLRYPFDELVGIVALESHRHRCLVIGEDLGTVPAGLQARLQEYGILSYRLLYFEREADGSFRRPPAYPRHCVTAVSTHDLPTLPGFWSGSDIVLRERLDLYPTPDRLAADRAARPNDRRMLAAALRAEGLPAAEDPAEVPTAAVYRFLARTPSRLVLVHVEDAFGITDQINLPGTVDEHPNWRRRLPLDVDALFDDPRLAQLFAALNDERPPLNKPLPEATPQSANLGGSDLAVPRATYRLQLNALFTFDDATEIVPYLAALGVSHVYASPFLKARPGSTHGYDVADQNSLNPEIGSEEAFERFSDALQRQNMGLILDFVPNHMGIGRDDNEWWLDLLEWGQNSIYADYFDIEWSPRQRQLAGKVLVPLLGDHYGAVLERGEIELRFDRNTGSFSVWYHEHRLPIRPRHYAIIIRRHLADAEAVQPLDETARTRLAELAAAFDKLRRPERRQRAAVRERALTLKAELAKLCRRDASIDRFIETATVRFNGRPGESKSFRQLHGLLERQAYRLAFWRVAADEVNYRRFFNINELAGIRMENPALFEVTHRLVGRLIATGRVQGIRLDHVDGLFDPQKYCQRLQEFAAQQQRSAGNPETPFYIVVEKILARHESLRQDWPIAGTTGYEFANLVNGLFVDPAGQHRLQRVYRLLVGGIPTFDETLAAAKNFVVDNILAGELNVLANELDRISERHWGTRDYTGERLRAALKEIVVHFPVYRTYVTGKGATTEDRRDIDWAVRQTKRDWRGADPEILDFVSAALTGDLARRGGPYKRGDVLRFAMKFQQYTGPVTAKSLEDTSFYRYNLLLSLNEVGGDPRQFSVSPAAFHHANRQRLQQWPQSMLATATHDTKRGEDARTRIDVLSEMPETWSQRVRRWAVLNRFLRREVDGVAAPSGNDEYMIYQTLIGAWPAELVGAPVGESDSLRAFATRTKDFVLKAVREAKVVTSWDNPNPAYEEACTAFVERMLDASRANPFLADFVTFQAQVAFLGMLGSLSQTVLKLTVPGIPDTYQGTELWDLSLVDPDNRRPVDFAWRQRLLDELRRPDSLATAERIAWLRELFASWHDGRIKAYLLQRLLQLRARDPSLLRDGDYERSTVTGTRAGHLVAFLRSRGDRHLLVTTGRLFAGLLGPFADAYPGASAWDDTAVAIPAGLAGTWVDGLTGATIAAQPEGEAAALPARTMLAALPVAVLIRSEG